MAAYNTLGNTCLSIVVCNQYVMFLFRIFELVYFVRLNVCCVCLWCLCFVCLYSVYSAWVCVCASWSPHNVKCECVYVAGVYAVCTLYAYLFVRGTGCWQCCCMLIQINIPTKQYWLHNTPVRWRTTCLTGAHMSAAIGIFEILGQSEAYARNGGASVADGSDMWWMAGALDGRTRALTERTNVVCVVVSSVASCSCS